MAALNQEYSDSEINATATVMDADEMRRAWTRIAHEILERNKGNEGLALIGILRKGGPLADRLSKSIERIEGSPIACGSLDISLYRDDFRTYQPRVGTTSIPFDIEGKRVILIDDVLSTGRTVRAALGALNDLGRPASIQLAVLIDRGHRELPIRPDYVGKNLPTSRNEFVRVSLTEFDGLDRVEIYKEGRMMGDSFTKRKDLLDLQSLHKTEIEYLLDTAQSFKEILGRPVKKVPTLRGRSVAMLFFEPSTRTRTSFEHAAKIMSADTYSLAGNTSSLVKGESLKDTMLTLDAMGIDAFVIRHGYSGAAELAAKFVPKKPVINAGDGTHEHPTQGLLDLLTIREAKGRIEGLTVAIVGDIAHSRVARSNIWGLHALGATVRLVGPSTLIPADAFELPVTVYTNLSEGLEGADVVNVLRIQMERQNEAFFPSTREYASLFGVSKAKLKGAKPDVTVLHPGPMNRGLEISAALADDPEISVITDQVTNGVAVRMAVLFWLMGGAAA